MINDPIPRNKRPLTAAQAFERIATSRDTRDDRCRRLLHDAAFDFKTREQEHEEALIERVPRAQSRQLGIMLMALEAGTPPVEVQGRGIAAPVGLANGGPVLSSERVPDAELRDDTGRTEADWRKLPTQPYEPGPAAKAAKRG